jgi:hypothetical protein
MPDGQGEGKVENGEAGGSVLLETVKEGTKDSLSPRDCRPMSDMLLIDLLTGV